MEIYVLIGAVLLALVVLVLGIRGVRSERDPIDERLGRYDDSSYQSFLDLEDEDQPEEDREASGFYPGKSTRIDCGRFRRQKLPVFAQCWGALAVCYEAERGLARNENLGFLVQELPAFIREGVSSISQLEWLHAIGGVDRVLAHELARVWSEVDSSPTSGRKIRNVVKRWRKKQDLIPTQLEDKFRRALEGVFGWE